MRTGSTWIETKTGQEWKVKKVDKRTGLVVARRRRSTDERAYGAMQFVRLFTEKPKGKAKYGNHRVEHDGKMFNSKGEVARLLQLQLLQKKGVITELVYDQKKLHYDLTVGDYVVSRYTPDFRYKCVGRVVIEDYKGNPKVTETQAYVIRAKLFFLQYGYEISVISQQDLRAFTSHITAEEHLNEVQSRAAKRVRNMRRK